MDYFLICGLNFLNHELSFSTLQVIHPLIFSPSLFDIAEDEKKNLATCWENSVSYREGEKFISKSNPCYECLCHKDFDNTTITENSHCRKLNCDIELKYKSFIQRGCLPIFEDDKCCPIDWKCRECVFMKLISNHFIFDYFLNLS